ncbi:amino acid adenylation domain-containing protein [Streptomyces sp. NPDC002067]
MTDPTDPLLAALVARGGDLRAEAGALRLRGPATVLTPELRADVATHRDALLARLADRRMLPLSGIQRRLWFLQELDTTGTGYTFSYASRLRGRLDVAALDAALGAVLAAHPGLRAGFAELTGHPVQFLPDTATVTTTVLDPGPDGDWAAPLRAHLVRPFDLSRPPLLRSALVRLGDDDWIWGVTVHHLIADGWTYGLLLDGVSAAFTGAAIEPAADYAEFVAHERAVADAPARLAALDHWAKTLTDAVAEAPADLPTDHPRPRERGYRGATASATLPAATVRRLRALAEAEGTTLFAALLAVHGVMLARHTGAGRALVGTPYANRPDARFHTTGGCFVSTLVLPVDLTGGPAFRALLARTGRTCATAWDHSDYAYEQLVERLAPQRDPSRNALFQTFLALQDLPGGLDLPGLTCAPVPFDAGTTQFDLEVYLTPAPGDTLELELRYRTDLFDPATADGFARRWQQLATRLADDPDATTTRVPVLSDTDRQALTTANDTARPYPHEATADALFAAQATRTPDRTALRCGDTEWTYRHLDARADALAALLHTAVRPGDRVGILMHRSADMVAAVLASLRAGTPFVPLAPDLPAARLAQLAADCGLTAVWTGPDTAALLPDGVRPLDATAPAPGGPPPRDTVTDPRTTAAYTLFTSGSTGVPKGVEVPHAALVNLLTTMTDRPGLGPDDTLVAVTALFFDISLLELLAPLLTGATLVVATDAETRDPDRLAALLERHGATVAQATPSTWRMLLDSGWTGRAALRVWSGGEALSRDLADRLLAACAEVWNLYGPTETTIWSARWRVTPGDGPVLLGEPVANTALHVLDRHGMPVPPGVPGELYIAGDGLALGYLHRPDLTAERFVTLDTGDGRPERAYRTGDLVRRLPDGTPVYLGRTDDQLKIRGHRIEPEEIEQALRRHPAVREAVVVPADGDTLIAHLLATDPAAPPTEDELAAHLGGLLRPALIPQRFVCHPDLPRTANGKTDRGALRRTAVPAPRAATTGAEPPESPEERTVAAVYEEVLGTTGIGRYDDFFRLGGHSLAATTVLYRLREATGVRVPLPAFLQDATVAAVAGHLRPADDLEAALALLESLSDEEAAALLAGTDPAA